MKPKHIEKGLTRLTERREALSAELASIDTDLAQLTLKRAAVCELLALVHKQEAAAEELQKGQRNAQQ